MLIPKLAAILGLVGVVCLVLSAFVGATSIADWVLDAAQAFLILAAILIEGYVIGGIVMDVMHAT
jgi:lipid-binding SYLF domain-containing protein